MASLQHARTTVHLVSVTEAQQRVLEGLVADAKRALGQEGLDYTSSETVDTVAAALDYALEVLGMPGLDDEEGEDA